MSNLVQARINANTQEGKQALEVWGRLRRDKTRPPGEILQDALLLLAQHEQQHGGLPEFRLNVSATDALRLAEALQDAHGTLKQVGDIAAQIADIQDAVYAIGGMLERGIPSGVSIPEQTKRDTPFSGEDFAGADDPLLGAVINR